MENKGDSIAVYELPGEPAIVINGVPELISCGSNGSNDFPSSSTVETNVDLGSGLGEWFLGREIGKWFKGTYYKGKVTNYDKESGWYRILYDDGDSEDLDWKELEEVLLPLDVTVSLKTLTQRAIRKTKKQSLRKPRKSESGSQNPPIKRCRK